MKKRSEIRGQRSGGVNRLAAVTFLFALCALLYAPGAFAGWNTNAWPAHEHLRAGATNIQDLYDAVSERRHAAGGKIGTAPTTPSWYRFNRALLINYKGIIAEMFKHDTAHLQHTNGWVDLSYHSSGLDGSGAFHKLTPGRLAELCRLPANYLDYTPWRCLDGVGPFTNDPTVGRGYGWTNAYTVVGGTNYPAGRTNWYTTDYGYDGLRQIVTNMQAYFRGDVMTWNTDLTVEYIIKNTNGYPTGTGATYSAASTMFVDGWQNNWGTNGYFGSWFYLYYVVRFSSSYGLYTVNGWRDSDLYDTLLQGRWAVDLEDQMDSFAVTQLLDRADIYAHWYGTNLCGFEPSVEKDGTNFVLWTSLPASNAVPPFETQTPGLRLYSSNFFGSVTLPASYPGYGVQLTNGVKPQGVLYWFKFVYK